MAHRLNTNKQSVVRNGILAFTVIFVVVVFIYMSLRLQREEEAVHHFSETYSIQLIKGFVGDSISLFANDSLVMNKQIKEEPTIIEVGRLVKQNVLMVVDNQTETVAAFDLSEKGGTCRFEKDIDGIKQLPQKQKDVFFPIVQGIKDCEGRY